MAGTEMRIEVVYALPDRQYLSVVKLAPGASVADAIERSDILRKFPELSLAYCKLGIFGRLVAPERVLRNGERVEIYRPLLKDPKEARRERAARGQSIKASR